MDIQKPHHAEVEWSFLYLDCEIGFPAIVAEGQHLFSYRTQQLSPLAPMILHWRRCGKVGRRRDLLKPPGGYTPGGFFCDNWELGGWELRRELNR